MWASVQQHVGYSVATVQWCLRRIFTEYCTIHLCRAHLHFFWQVVSVVKLVNCEYYITLHMQKDTDILIGRDVYASLYTCHCLPVQGRYALCTFSAYTFCAVWDASVHKCLNGRCVSFCVSVRATRSSGVKASCLFNT